MNHTNVPLHTFSVFPPEITERMVRYDDPTAPHLNHAWQPAGQPRQQQE